MKSVQTKKYALLAGVLAIGLLVLLRWVGQGPHHLRGLSALSSGTVHAFDVELATEVKANTGRVAQFGLRGVLEIEHMPGSKHELAVRLRNASLTSDTAGAEAKTEMVKAGREFLRPLVVELDARGAIVRTHEDDGVRQQVRSMVKSMLAMAQFVEPEHATPAWENEEEDPSGRYRAAYESHELDHALKHKLRYEALASASGLDDASIQVTASKHEYWFQAQGAPKRVEVSEALKAHGQYVEGLETTTRFKLERRTEPGEAFASSDVRANLRPSSLSTLLMRDGFSAEADWARVAGRSFSTMLEELEELPVGPAMLDASPELERKSRHNFIGMAALFRLEASAIDEAMEAIEDGQVKSPARIWDALAAAGTPRAQAALRTLIEMPEWTLPERRSQMIGLSLVQRPTAESVEFLAQRFDDPEQGEQARLGVGSAAYNLRSADPELANVAFERVAESLLGSDEPNDQWQYLRAVGNSGHPKSLELARGYVEAENEMVRAGAAHALRRTPQAEATEELAKLALHDPDAFVRTAAVRGLADRGVSDFTVGVLTQVAKTDPVQAVQSEAISVLARFASEQPALASLVAQLSQESAGS